MVKNVRIKQRVDTKTNWENSSVVLLENELAFEAESGKYKLGDGTSTWSELPIFGGGEYIIVINITPALADVTATISQNKIAIAVGKSNANGQIYLTVQNTGFYDISYDNTQVTSNANISITEKQKIYSIDATYKAFTPVTYTLKIDTTNSNSLTCCEYMDDAAAMTKGSADWDTMPIFEDIKPCVFKNGAVNYYLNPNDFNLKENGNAAVLTGEDGDVMIEFKKFAYRIYQENSNTYVSITNDPDVAATDDRFHYYAFTRETEGDIEAFYWGAFKGYVDGDDKLRSISGVSPTVSDSLNQFSTKAKANGENYDIMSFLQLTAIQCLYLIKYGNLNSQAALGKGYTSASAETTTGQTLDKGMYYGDTTSGPVQVKFAGIEDFWGNVYDWLGGLSTDSSCNLIIPVGNQTLTVSVDDPENGGYISDIQGSTAGGFVPDGYSGSSTTYWADYGYVVSDSSPYFGGSWSDDDSAGAFRLRVVFSADIAVSDIGSRLAFV